MSAQRMARKKSQPATAVKVVPKPAPVRKSPSPKAATPKAATTPNLADVAEPDDASPLLLTVEQAARKLGICRDFMYRLLAHPRPQVRSVKLGRSRRVPVSKLEAYIARRLSEVA